MSVRFALRGTFICFQSIFVFYQNSQNKSFVHLNLLKSVSEDSEILGAQIDSHWTHTLRPNTTKVMIFPIWKLIS